MLIDTHCHLDFPEFNLDRDAVIRRARDEGIEYIVNIGSSLQGSLASLGLSREYAFIFATVGIHPHEADSFKPQDEVELRGLAGDKKVVAIGEIGLDYYRNFSKAENQRNLFSSLIKLAKDLNLPLVVHSRQASADTLGILKEFMPLKAVVHCFSGDQVFLKDCLDLGFYISFTCNVTYKKADSLRKIVELAPLKNIFLETDAPYLAPEAMRGKRNEPANIKLLAETIAGIKHIS
ncbi:MAG TPA: TatD family hydrolase, partial [Candidatus Margulisiibacteriota bacterium]|nr:TatD family hydrolase [Candidatus Margulisiibacteriota bacterium]